MRTSRKQKAIICLVLLAVVLLSFYMFCSQQPRMKEHTPANPQSADESDNLNTTWIIKESSWTLYSSRLNATLEIIDMSDHTRSISAQRRFFRRHAHKNFTMIIPVNSGFLYLGLNFLCSLRRLRAEFISSVVIWALDDQVIEKLKSIIQSQIESSQHHSDILSFSGFGVYTTSSKVSSSSLERGGTKNYVDMMNLRPDFFLHLLQNVGINFLFADADIVALRDPWIQGPLLPFFETV